MLAKLNLNRKLLLGVFAAALAATVLLGASFAGGAAQSSADTNLDSEEQAFVTLINDYRAQTASPRCPSTGAAAVGRLDGQRHGREQVLQPQRPSGPQPLDRMCAFGYCYNTYKGENIAAGYTTAQPVFTPGGTPPATTPTCSAPTTTPWASPASTRPAARTAGTGPTTSAATCVKGNPDPPRAPTNTPSATATPSPTPTHSPTATPRRRRRTRRRLRLRRLTHPRPRLPQHQRRRLRRRRPTHRPPRPLLPPRRRPRPS